MAFVLNYSCTFKEHVLQERRFEQREIKRERALYLNKDRKWKSRSGFSQLLNFKLPSIFKRLWTLLIFHKRIDVIDIIHFNLTLYRFYGFELYMAPHNLLMFVCKPICTCVTSTCLFVFDFTTKWSCLHTWFTLWFIFMRSELLTHVYSNISTAVQMARWECCNCTKRHMKISFDEH